MNIRTVLGDIPAEQMGKSYTHEHLICSAYPVNKDPLLGFEDAEERIQDLKYFKNAGGGTLVEGTCIDFGRNPEKMRTISKEADVHVIATTGYYTHEYHPDVVETASVEELADIFIKEIRSGMDDTKIRAGQIKCAVSLMGIHKKEEKCLRAAAVVSKKTNAPIWIHHGGIMGMKILDILEEETVESEKIVLGHMDRNPDPNEYMRIAERGVYLSVDNLARVKRYPIGENLKVLRDLFDGGYMDHVLISADLARPIYFQSYGGYGYEFILKEFIPRMQEELKISKTEMEQIFVKNPQKVYGCF
ncbi:MAG: phosphotriesterase [Hespellia sp.]|jgi:predicted metal-dependent phosphotriesterase family hydrolase|nr:phosphotriesterase [Hespellia sp.]